MSIEKLPVYEDFPSEKGQNRLILWIKNKIYKPVSSRINWLLDFFTDTGDDTAPGFGDVSYIQFDITFADGVSEGRLQWNIEDGTLEVGMPGGEVNLQIGQEQLIRGKNVTGTGTTNGRPVRISGASGSNPEFGFADANDPALAGSIGLFTEDIANNANGYVTTFGLVRDIDTSGPGAETWVAGDRIFVSNTIGELTNVSPTSDERIIFIGIVLRVSATVGVLFVSPINVSYLSELSGNNFSTEVDKNIIQFNGTIWENLKDLSLADDAFVIFDKASGNGIKVDTTTPTFGFADIIGDQFSRNTGATKPTLAAYNGAVNAWQFGNGDEAFMSFHIPHDYVIGTDVFLHIHWSQNAAGATGGTVDFRYTAIYAKGHNQTSGSTFTATPKTALFSSIDINDGGSGLNQYQQHLTEVVISAATATAALFDRDDFEPDGVIEMTLEMDATNLTGTPSLPFIHFADIHYQSTGLIGTKDKVPDFYA